MVCEAVFVTLIPECIFTSDECRIRPSNRISPPEAPSDTFRVGGGLSVSTRENPCRKAVFLKLCAWEEHLILRYPSRRRTG